MFQQVPRQVPEAGVSALIHRRLGPRSRACGFGDNRVLNGNDWKVIDVANIAAEIMLSDQDVRGYGFSSLDFLNEFFKF